MFDDIKFIQDMILWIQRIHILRSEHFTTNGSPLLSWKHGTIELEAEPFAKFHSKFLQNSGHQLLTLGQSYVGFE